MGMDVYGKKPTTDAGQYFRRSVWGWRPLWQYVENVHPEIAGLVKDGHSNSGHGLNGEKSAELASHLRTDITNGVVAEYVTARNQILAELPRDVCKFCNGSGIRTDAVGVENKMPEHQLEEAVAIILGRTHGWCNACRGEGMTDNFTTNYFLDETDIAEFAEFLEGCGGFRIC
jgi:hypothetical protein